MGNIIGGAVVLVVCLIFWVQRSYSSEYGGIFPVAVLVALSILGVMLAGVIGLEAASDSSLAVPLLATQILWINLLTDSAPALAMGVDPTSLDVMHRPPRRLKDRVISLPMHSDLDEATQDRIIAAVASFKG